MDKKRKDKSESKLYFSHKQSYSPSDLRRVFLYTPDSAMVNAI
jgi:hypothetical protein